MIFGTESVAITLTKHLYDKNIRLETNTKKDLFTKKSMKLIWISIKNYVSHINSKNKKSIFLGASTGLFKHNEKILDSYFPYKDQNPSDVIYFMSCGNLQELYSNLNYVKEYNIVVNNYILGILKHILSTILATVNKKKFISFIPILANHNIDISPDKLNKSYFDFIAGYHLYKIIFKFLNIDIAYIVSPSTKSDMCAALKSLNVKIIEIQHGTVGITHGGYNYNLPHNKKLPVPDEINVYNQFWKDEVISAGYFTVEQINITGRLKYDLVNDVDFTKDNNYIIFTGQGAYIKEIVKFFIQSNEILIDNDIKLIYKSHPREIQSELDYIRKEFMPYKALELYNGSYSTEVLIKNSLAHISIFSACHFDAIHFHDKTYILDIMENNPMQYYNNSYPKKFIMIESIRDVLGN